MRSFRLALLCALQWAIASIGFAQPLIGPTVRELVEFTHIVQPRDEDTDALREQVSPDGRHAFIVTRKGQVASDRNRYEILLLDVSPDQLASQRTPAPTIVLSVEAEYDNDFGRPAIQDVHWSDDRTLVFLGRLKGATFQVYRLNWPTRELVQLTHEPTSVVSFSASRDLRRVVYAVQVPNPPLHKGAHSVTVGSQSFWAVKFGQEDIRAQRRMYRYFVADTSPASPSGAPRSLGDAFAEGNGQKPLVSISPDGRWALLPRYEPDRLEEWSRQYPLVAELAKRFAHSQQVDPLAYFSRAQSYVPRRMTAWHLDDGREHAVLDAPDDSAPLGGQLRSDRLWQGSGASVVLAGTHLPIAGEDSAALASRVAHIVEYWPDTGRWSDIARLANRLEDLHALRDGFIAVEGGKRREFHRLPGGGWRESTEGSTGGDSNGPTWALHVLQALNRPPDVFASGPVGQTTRLTSLNPQFRADSWGTMQSFSWHDEQGRQWDGGLMLPNGMEAHRRYPLVIQTYGFSAQRFYLDGANLHSGATSAFAGRAFLRHGILVLALPYNASGGQVSPGQETFEAFNDGVRGAIDALVKLGRVDPGKVGIIGWSATGLRVLNLVTFSDVPIRAATMADGDANTLFSYTVTYAAIDSIWGLKEQYNEGLPFGDAMSAWSRNDPAMHTDCIRAALRIETYGPWVLNNWDLHALLRRQYKPVEMVVIPGGSHQLATPGDRMVSLQGNLDWFTFWLKGENRASPVLAGETPTLLAEQYRQWQQMEVLKSKDDARPRCMR